MREYDRGPANTIAARLVCALAGYAGNRERFGRIFSSGRPINGG
jgi:hypothetical protein